MVQSFDLQCQFVYFGYQGWLDLLAVMEKASSAGMVAYMEDPRQAQTESSNFEFHHPADVLSYLPKKIKSLGLSLQTEVSLVD